MVGMIELAGLTKRYGEKVAVNNLTFTLECLAARDEAIAVVHDDFLDEVALDIGHRSEGLSRGESPDGYFRPPPLCLARGGSYLRDRPCLA